MHYNNDIYLDTLPMTTQRRGGPKRSSWLIFRRRLVMVRYLLRGPSSSAELRAAVENELGPDTWGEAPEAALRRDISALKSEFGCQIRYRARTGYTLVDLGELHLFDLPDDYFQAFHLLTLLANSLPAQLANHASELLLHITDLLPPARRLPLEGDPLAYIDSPYIMTSPDTTLLRQVRRSVRRQQIRFRYRSTFTDEPEGILHRAAPYGIRLRDGHMYLDADSLWAEGDDFRQRRLLYRLDRIVPESLEVLPDTVPPLRLPPSNYTVRYWLAPAVARQRDMALHFDQSRAEFHSDGSATVSGSTDNLWRARMLLLRYGAHCRVLGPPELVTLMREMVTAMHDLYNTDTNLEATV